MIIIIIYYNFCRVIPIHVLVSKVQWRHQRKSSSQVTRMHFFPQKSQRPSV